MLKELIIQAFCRETRRKLRRLGVLGLIASGMLALYVELPLEIAIATREAQVAMAGIQQSIDGAFAHWEHHILELQKAKQSHCSIEVCNSPTGREDHQRG